MKDFVRKNIGLFVLMLLHTVVMVLLFSFVKTEFHSDEIWSFGIANGSVSGAIFEDENGNPINIGEWISGEVIHENITVQDSERFDFSIPYRNAKNDYHPPLTFFLIHLMGSFFPDTFSFWFFIPFNILAMLLCDLYLYRIMKLYEIPNVVCIILCLANAFCMGGLSMAMFLRMYTLLTAFGLMIIFYSLRVYKEQKIRYGDLLKIITVNLLGGLTCYEYYVFAFFIALSVCTLFLCKKQIVFMVKYGLGMLAGILVSLALFPDAITDMFGNFGGGGFSGWTTYPFVLQLKMLICFILRDIIGIALNPYAPFFQFFVPILYVIVYVTVICFPLFYFLRKSPQFVDGIARIRRRIKSHTDIFLGKLRQCFSLLFVCILGSTGFLIVMNNTISVYLMKEQSIRYLFVIYPIILLLFGISLYVILNGIIIRPGVTHVFLCVIFLFSMVNSYLTGNRNLIVTAPSEGMEVQKIVNSRILIVVKYTSGFERLINVIDRSNLVLVVPYDTMQQYESEIREMKKDADCFVIVEEAVYNNSLVTDTLNSGKVTLEYDDFDEKSTETMQTHYEDTFKEIENYLHMQSVTDKLEKVGKKQMLNEGFDIYKITERGE